MRTTGYIDPNITPSTRREAAVLDAIRERGLCLHRVHHDGNTLRLTGPDIFVLVDGLAPLSLSDLVPPSAMELKARARLLAQV